MVEVFKTNVESRAQAEDLLERIHRRFVPCKANFDLDDCDRILRLVCADEDAISGVIELLREAGFEASILEDIS